MAVNDNGCTLDSANRDNRILNAWGIINLLLAITACVWGWVIFGPGLHTTNTGLQYRRILSGTGEVPRSGEYYYIEDYITWNGKIIRHKNENPHPKLVSRDSVEKNNYDGGIYEIIGMLKKGEEYVFKIKASSLMSEDEMAYRCKNMNQQCTTNSEVILNIKVKDIVTSDKAYTVFQEYDENRKKECNKRITVDDKKIDEYIKKNGINAERKRDGLFMSIVKHGDSNKIKVGDEVYLRYYVTFDKKIRETNIESIAKENDIWNEKKDYAPLKIKIRDNMPGIFSCLSYVGKGAEINIYASPSLAFGDSFMFDDQHLGIINITVADVISNVDEKTVQKNEQHKENQLKRAQHNGKKKAPLMEKTEEK